MLHITLEALLKQGFDPKSERLSEMLTEVGALWTVGMTHDYLRQVDRGKPQMSFRQLMQFTWTSLRFIEKWNAETYPHLTPDVKRMMAKLAELNPTKRPSIGQTLRDSCWDEVRVAGNTA